MSGSVWEVEMILTKWAASATLSRKVTIFIFMCETLPARSLSPNYIFQHSSWHNLVMRNRPSPSTHIPADPIWNSNTFFRKCDQWQHAIMIEIQANPFIICYDWKLICYQYPPLSMSLTRQIRHWNWHLITGNIWRRLLIRSALTLVTGRDSWGNWAHLSRVWPALIRSDRAWPGAAHSAPTFNLLEGRLLQMLSKASVTQKCLFFSFFPCTFLCLCCTIT